MKYYGLSIEQDYSLIWEYSSCDKYHDDFIVRMGFPFWENGIRKLTIPIEDPDKILGKHMDAFCILSSIRGPTPIPVVSSRFISAFDEKVFEDAYWKIPLTYDNELLTDVFGMKEKPEAVAEISDYPILSKPAYASADYPFIVTEKIRKQLEGLNLPDCKWKKVC